MKKNFIEKNTLMKYNEKNSDESPRNGKII